MSTLKSVFKNSDIKLYYFFNRKLCCKPLDVFLGRLTTLFDPVASIFIILALYIISSTKHLTYGNHLLFVIAISQVITHVLKRIFGRIRPFEELEYARFRNEPPKDIYSFPSGHTCAAFAMSLVLSFYFPMYKDLFYSMAIMVGLSRMYLGFHYPTDVIVGALIPFAVNLAYLNYFII